MEPLETVTRREAIREVERESILKRVISSGSKYIDYRMGTLGALVMGTTVGTINSDYGVIPATTAGLKQALYTFFVGGFVTKTCEFLATNVKNKVAAYTSSIIIPTIMTVGLTYGVHNMKGTPEPFKSTIPTIAISIPGFSYWANRSRKKMN